MPYTLQLNGIRRIKNTNLVELATYMLHNAKSKPIHACICIRIWKQKVHSVRDARCRCREASHSLARVYPKLHLVISQTHMGFALNAI